MLLGVGFVDDVVITLSPLTITRDFNGQKYKYEPCSMAGTMVNTRRARVIWLRVLERAVFLLTVVMMLWLFFQKKVCYLFHST